MTTATRNRVSLLDRFPRTFDALAWVIFFAMSGAFGWMIAAWLSGGI
jgi:hypothetical protein